MKQQSLVKYIAIRNKDMQLTQLEAAKQAGFEVSELGKMVEMRHNGATNYLWSTPFGILQQVKGKLTLLTKKSQIAPFADKVKVTTLPPTIKPISKQVNKQNMEKQETATAEAPVANETIEMKNVTMVNNAPHIPYDKIKIDKGLNPREDFGDVEELKGELIAAGLLNPLTVRPADKDGEYFIVQGHRRHKAIGLMIKDGYEWPDGIEVNFEDPATTPAQRQASQLLGNDGKPLTIAEQGTIYARLINDFKYKTSAIAKLTGYTMEHVRNCIKLANAAPEIKDAVNKGEIKSTAAVNLVKGTKDKAEQLEILEQAKKAAKVDPKTGKKKKITGAALTGTAGKKKDAEPTGEGGKSAKVRLTEVKDLLVSTDTKAKYSDSKVWDILDWIETGKGSIVKLIGI